MLVPILKLIGHFMAVMAASQNFLPWDPVRQKSWASQGTPAPGGQTWMRSDLGRGSQEELLAPQHEPEFVRTRCFSCTATLRTPRLGTMFSCFACPGEKLLVIGVTWKEEPGNLENHSHAELSSVEWCFWPQGFYVCVIQKLQRDV